MQRGSGHEEFLCGGVAAVANIVITFPINKLIFRQQLNGSRVRRAVAELRSEGLRNAYRGMLPPLLQKGASLSLMFGTYDIFLKRLAEVFPPNGTQKIDHLRQVAVETTTGPKRITVQHRVERVPLRHQIIAGLLAGSVESILIPFERVQTLMQDKAYHVSLRNTAHAFRELSKHGILEYYRGFSAVFVRNGPSTALFFALRERVAGCCARWKPLAERRAVSEFISGALCGAATGTIFFPVNVAKNTMQARIGGPFASFTATLQAIYAERDRSLRMVYRGLSLTLLRTVLSWGIINMTYEQCKTHLFAAPSR